VVIDFTAKQTTDPDFFVPNDRPKNDDQCVG